MDNLNSGTNCAPQSSLANSSSSSAAEKKFAAINIVLRDIFSVLSYQKDRYPSLLGCAVSGLDSVYLQYLRFVLQCRSRSGMEANHRNSSQSSDSSSSRSVPAPEYPKGSEPNLGVYIVSCDIKSCFDSIDRSKVFTMLEQIVGNNRYCLEKFSLVEPNQNGRSDFRSRRFTLVNLDGPLTVDSASPRLSGLARTSQGVFSNTGLRRYQDRTSVNSLLHQHLTSNLVRLGSVWMVSLTLHSVSFPCLSV